jgi:CRISPR-associated protein Cmr2
MSEQATPHRYDYWLSDTFQAKATAIWEQMESYDGLEARQQRRSEGDEKKRAAHGRFRSLVDQGDQQFVLTVATLLHGQLSGDPQRQETFKRVWNDFAGTLIRGAENTKTNTPVPNQPPAALVNLLPQGSWLLQLTATLIRPYFSRNDAPWSVMHNPITRDIVSGLPAVKATTWKGHLRFAAEFEMGPNDPVIGRLFGEASEKETGNAGRLWFFDSLIHESSTKDVITPLDRKRRFPVPGRGPIEFDVVSSGSDVPFTLLYLADGSNATIQDSRATLRAVVAMLTTYGFSAKKNMGWGLVADEVHEGSLNFPAKPIINRVQAVEGAAIDPHARQRQLYAPFFGDDDQPLPWLRGANDLISANTYRERPEESRPAGVNAYAGFRNWYPNYVAAQERAQDTGQDRLPRPIKFAQLSKLESAYVDSVEKDTDQ